MREIRVYSPRPIGAAGSELELDAAAAQHVTRVLRLRAGAMLTLFDGRGGEWTVQIARLVSGRCSVRIDAHRPIERESPLHLTLLQALARGEKMDWVLQKATELGVARILPVATERSVVQLDEERAGRRVEHWQAVVAAACEQCGRNRLPEVLAPRSLEAACRLAAATPATTRLVLAPGSPETLASVAVNSATPGEPKLPSTRDIALLIGPEGGLSEVELGYASAAGFAPVSLGPRVLRTETAAIAALALLQGLAGDFG